MNFTLRSARRGLSAAAILAITSTAIAACGDRSDTGMPGMDHGTTSSSSPGGGHGMDMPVGDGLAASASGFTFVPSSTTVRAGAAASFTFQIRGGNGAPVTSFVEEQAKLMHFYVISSDLAGFNHVHPEMAADGTWTAPLTELQPGSYRAYASFTANGPNGKHTPLVLSVPVTVPGDAAPVPLPPPAASTQVDGYTLAVSGDLQAGMTHGLTVTFAKNGKPVTDLRPYLDSYAHLTAFHEGDLAFAHLHPQGSVTGGQAGPALTFDAMLPKPGNWRLYLQFQTGGTLHTAAITLKAGS